MKSKVLISLLIAIWSTGALANNDWGENFSWSVECDSATVGKNGPDDDCWVYNDNEKDEYGNPLTPFLGVIVNLEQLQKVEEAYLEWDDENGNIGRDTLSVYTKNGGDDCCVKVFNSWKPVYGYDEIVNVPCVLLHRNCKNILKIKVRTVTVPPTIIHFVADDASEINKHPFYGDCNWTSLLPPIIVKCHRHCYDVYDHYDWDEFDTYLYYTSYEYDKYVVENDVINVERKKSKKGINYKINLEPIKNSDNLNINYIANIITTKSSTIPKQSIVLSDDEKQFVKEFNNILPSNGKIVLEINDVKGISTYIKVVAQIKDKNINEFLSYKYYELPQDEPPEEESSNFVIIIIIIVIILIMIILIAVIFVIRRKKNRNLTNDINQIEGTSGLLDNKEKKSYELN